MMNYFCNANCWLFEELTNIDFHSNFNTILLFLVIPLLWRITKGSLYSTWCLHCIIWNTLFANCWLFEAQTNIVLASTIKYFIVIPCYFLTGTVSNDVTVLNQSYLITFTLADMWLKTIYFYYLYIVSRTSIQFKLPRAIQNVEYMLL